MAAGASSASPAGFFAKFPGLTREWQRYALVTMVAAATMIAAEWQGAIRFVDDFYYDAWHLVAGKRREAQHVAIVSVDDDTFDRLKEDPLAFWQPHFATAMKVLEQANAKIVGLDFTYATSAETWLKRLNLPESQVSRTYDAGFRERLAAGNKVLVGHLYETSSGEIKQALPPPEHFFLLPNQLQDVGMANLYPDVDSIVRRYLPVLVTQEGLPGVGFSTLMALRSMQQDPAAAVWNMAGDEIPRKIHYRRVGFIGPTGSIPRVSMSQLFEPDALTKPAIKALTGRVVLITAHDSSSLQDTHLTPYSRGLPGFERTQMTGGEVHANIVETLMTGRYPHDLPRALVIALILSAAAVSAFVFLRRNPFVGATFGIALAAIAAFASYSLFKFDWLFPTAAAQFTVLLAFLLTLALRLTGEERERRRLRTMFGSYVSDDVVDLLITQRGEGEGLDLKGQEMFVTVLFSDIRSFTTISEKLSAHEVVEMLNTYFGKVCEPILNERGNVNKYIGDAVMAMFGSPVPYPDHARRAVKAALGMLKATDEFRGWMEQRFPDRGLPRFDIGIGLHTGTVISGDIGTDKRREYTIIGDTVNAASRLEGMTKELGWRIVASRVTLEAAGEGVICGEGSSIHVKGRSAEIDVVEILGVREVNGRSVGSVA